MSAVPKTLCKQYLEQLTRRLQAFFDEQAQGFDIPPADLYRLEGFIEAGIQLNLCTEEGVRQQLVELAEAASGTELAEFYRRDYRLILHMRMPEAPVYPSTTS